MKSNRPNGIEMIVMILLNRNDRVHMGMTAVLLKRLKEMGKALLVVPHDSELIHARSNFSVTGQ